jgi:hypothetical protein
MMEDERKTIGGIEARVDYHDKMLDEIREDVKAIRKTLDEARGGGRVMLWFVGLVSGGIGALIVKVINLFGTR